MDNAGRGIVRSKKNLHHIKAVCPRTFPQGIQISTNSPFLSTTLARIYRGITSAQIIFSPCFYLNEDEAIFFQCDNINFIPPVPPISQEHFYSRAPQIFCRVIFPQFPALLTKRSFFFSKKQRSPFRQPFPPHLKTTCPVCRIPVPRHRRPSLFP